MCRRLQKSPKHEPTDSYFFLEIQLSKCMMRSDAFNLHVYPVITEMTGTQQIPILQICSTDKSGSERIIVDESFTNESKSESVHKSINTNREKDAIDETYHEEPPVIYNPVIN